MEPGEQARPGRLEAPGRKVSGSKDDAVFSGQVCDLEKEFRIQIGGGLSGHATYHPDKHYPASGGRYDYSGTFPGGNAFGNGTYTLTGDPWTSLKLNQTGSGCVTHPMGKNCADSTEIPRSLRPRRVRAEHVAAGNASVRCRWRTRTKSNGPRLLGSGLADRASREQFVCLFLVARCRASSARGPWLQASRVAVLPCSARATTFAFTMRRACSTRRSQESRSRPRPESGRQCHGAVRGGSRDLLSRSTRKQDLS
jgi:hypothetical protein